MRNILKTTQKALILLGVFSIISCESDDVITEYDINELSEISISTTKGLRNQEINLELIGINGENFTEFATFYVNGDVLESNIFSSSVEGIFNVYAEYDLAGTITQSNLVPIEIFIPKRKVLFEDYTGTWCAYCTAMIDRVDEMREITTDISIISIHVGSNDPYTFNQAQTLLDYYKVSFVPTGYQDRQYFYGDAWPAEFVTDYAGLDSSITIALSSQLNGNELSVNVDVLSDEGLENKNIVIYLLEDGLIYNQANGSNNNPDSQFFQLGDPIINYVHDDVLRESLTGVFGDPIPSTMAYTLYSKNLTYSVPSEYDLSNLKLVAFVTDENNIAVNSQYADVNENKPFE